MTYKEATIIYSILKLGRDEGTISMDMLLAAFSTSAFLKMEGPSRYLHLPASPHICERQQELGHQRQKNKTEHLDCNPFSSIKQNALHMDINSAGGIWFPVKTHK